MYSDENIRISATFQNFNSDTKKTRTEKSLLGLYFESPTVGVRLLVGVSCVDETGGAVVFVLHLHVETRGLAEGAPGS